MHGDKIMKSINTLIALGAVVATASACATITRGSTEDVQFISSPSGATVKTTNGSSCTTPCTLKFDRRETFVATFTLGTQEKKVAVETEVAGGGAAGVAGNVLVGGVIGVGVDVATGAGLDHVPNPVTVTFDPEPPAPAETEAPAQVETEAPAEAEATQAVETTEPEPAPAPATGGDDGFKWES